MKQRLQTRLFITKEMTLACRSRSEGLSSAALRSHSSSNAPHVLKQVTISPTLNSPACSRDKAGCSSGASFAEQSCWCAVQQCSARGRLLLSPSTLQSYFQQCKMITRSHGIALMFVDALNGERETIPPDSPLPYCTGCFNSHVEASNLCFLPLTISSKRSFLVQNLEVHPSVCCRVCAVGTQPSGRAVRYTQLNGKLPGDATSYHSLSRMYLGLCKYVI